MDWSQYEGLAGVVVGGVLAASFQPVLAGVAVAIGALATRYIYALAGALALGIFVAINAAISNDTFPEHIAFVPNLGAALLWVSLVRPLRWLGRRGQSAPPEHRV